MNIRGDEAEIIIVAFNDVMLVGTFVILLPIGVVTGTLGNETFQKRGIWNNKVVRPEIRVFDFWVAPGAQMAGPCHMPYTFKMKTTNVRCIFTRRFPAFKICPCLVSYMMQNYKILGVFPDIQRDRNSNIIRHF